MDQSHTISTYFRADHDRLDELFRTFQACKRTDRAKAVEAFATFKAGLTRHIVWEEDLLFPLWEAKTGMSDGGPTSVMRAEHRDITARLDAIADQVAAGANSDADEQALTAVLGVHNLKEERVLYPAIDHVATEAERGELFRRIEERS